MIILKAKYVVKWMLTNELLKYNNDNNDGLSNFFYTLHNYI